MMSRSMRLKHGGRIARDTTLSFTFDGRRYTGFAGDTLASALLANDVAIIARSFKWHRPRGVLAAGIEEPNALVTVGEGVYGEVNLRATEISLYEGLSARSQNCWPSAGFDMAAVIGFFKPLLPTAFYHKTFKWPSWRWYEKAIRNAAGLGRLAHSPDPDRYCTRFHHCDVLVVGAGEAGLRAALSDAQSGAQVTLIDSDSDMGGSLLWGGGAWYGREDEAHVSSRRLEDILRQLREMSNVRLMQRTLALGCYEDNFVVALERLSDVHGPHLRTPAGCRQRLWKIRAAKLILATGAIERPMVFTKNDLPGVMLCSAVRIYLNRHAAIGGKNVVIFTNNDSAYATALDLHRSGVRVAAVIDVRQAPMSEIVDETRSAGITVYTGHAVARAHGRRKLSAVRIARLKSGAKEFIAGTEFQVKCDLLALSGGWNPTTQLFSQAGGTLRYTEEHACFIPDGSLPSVHCVGAANGDFSPAPAAWIQAFWRAPDAATHKQWVDYSYDVTVADIELAAREGFTSIEHLKRYTAVGMGVDQGKTGNVNALALLGQLTAREPPQVGTTTARPVFHPVRIGAVAGHRVNELGQRYRRLPITWHENHGAPLEDHSGWLRPHCYPHAGEPLQDAVAREASAARDCAALFDSSSLGKIAVFGPDATTFLNRLYINDVTTLKPGRLRYGMMLNENGIIKDDGVFGCIDATNYWVYTSSAGARDIHFWMQEWLQCEWRDLDVSLVPQTAQWATVTVSGPKARTVIAGLGLAVDLAASSFRHMHFCATQWQGQPMWLRRVSFTGELSFELDIAADLGESLWRRLMELGDSHGITPLGMEALDVLRIEKGYLEVGVDTDGETTPLDVGWRAAIDRKTHDFLGRRSLLRPAQQSSDRLQLIGLLPADSDRLLPVGAHALDERAEPIGHVTSSCFSHRLNRSIAMARIRSGYSRIDEMVNVDVDGEHHRAKIGPHVFYDPQGRRLHE
jgi:sarcosine oxidase, subunit alpha